LRSAEWAWDRCDNAACFRLGQSAFDPNPAGGPITFNLDPKAPAYVIARMIETLWRAGKLSEAWDLCEQAKRNGYLGRTSPTSDPMLELNYRKVAAQIKMASASPAN